MNKSCKNSLGCMIGIMALMLSPFASNGWGAAPEAPTMTVTTSGLSVTASWNSVDGAQAIPYFTPPIRL